MQIIIKSKNNAVIPGELKLYIREKLQKKGEAEHPPVVYEVVLEDLTGQSDGQDKSVHLTSTLARIKNPVHIEMTGNDYFSIIDRSVDKLNRAIHHAKR